MTLSAKYGGTCRACGCKIEIGETIVWAKMEGARHASPEQCREAMKRRDTERAAREAAGPHINLQPVATFLKGAQDRGLKHPKLRVLALDKKSELRLSLTEKGAVAGSVAVVERSGRGFVGCVRPDGATTKELKQDLVLQEYLLRVARDPIAAAKEYAALMGLCCFCGKELTDAGSVEVGYGPICAKHWNLPHDPKGTPMVHVAPKGD